MSPRESGGKDGRVDLFKRERRVSCEREELLFHDALYSTIWRDDLRKRGEKITQRRENKKRSTWEPVEHRAFSSGNESWVLFK
jgi:hypothetical protein